MRFCFLNCVILPCCHSCCLSASRADRPIRMTECGTLRCAACRTELRLCTGCILPSVPRCRFCFAIFISANAALEFDNPVYRACGGGGFCLVIFVLRASLCSTASCAAFRILAIRLLPAMAEFVDGCGLCFSASRAFVAFSAC